MGTNDLNSDRAPDFIAKSIIDMALTMKWNSQNGSILNIIMRNDNLNNKAMEINEVRNSRVIKSSYETELRKITSHFALITRITRKYL